MDQIELCGYIVPRAALDTVIVGSGAAGFCCAEALYRLGVTDLAIVTEGVNMGTSRNTGSDKQTYYKLTLTGGGQDSVYDMAESLFSGGAMHGDLALTEAAGSARAFFNLVLAGVPFPVNAYGEYAGYMTDHDSSRRATSCGPLTSRYMTEALERECRRDGINIFDGCRVIEILKDDTGARGVLAMSKAYISRENPFGLICFSALNTVYAVGGPSAIYGASVYPESQTCAHGAAYLAGAEGRNLTESQYGMASLNPRWNLSGTYQQVIPRYFSRGADGAEHNFLREYIGSDADIFAAIFKKGYEWPFDAAKSEGGSSRVDLAVYNERRKGRRVFLDYTREPEGFSLDMLSDEARDYLSASGALTGLPIRRLEIMNRPAIELFASKGVDLRSEPLEADVCAQHNNGGLAADINYESTSLPRFFPIGEACGVFGVKRPGGSALNSTQVGAYRAALEISHRRNGDNTASDTPVDDGTIELLNSLYRGEPLTLREILDRRAGYGMLTDECGAFIRDADKIGSAVEKSRAELASFAGLNGADNFDALRELMINRDVLVTRYIYLAAVKNYIERGGISRGSYLIPGRPAGADRLSGMSCRARLADGVPVFEWEKVRPIPQSEQWFEKVYNSGR